MPEINKNMPQQKQPSPERLSKFLSRAGVCSRRDAEKYIAEGLIQVNGNIVTTPVTFVTAKDRVLFDGNPVQGKEDIRLWLYYKPLGLVTTHKDPEGRPTVFDNLPRDMPRVISVGRLDLNSEGLLVLTNSGAFSRHAEHPKTGWKRIYKVRVFGHVDELKLQELQQGITIDHVTYQPIEAVLSRQSGRNAWLLVTLKEGKNREIRKVMNHIGLEVNRLIRIAYGPFELGSLKPGDIKEIKNQSAEDFLD